MKKHKYVGQLWKKFSFRESNFFLGYFKNTHPATFQERYFMVTKD